MAIKRLSYWGALGLSLWPGLLCAASTTATMQPDAGVVVQSGDFRATVWGFAERVLDPDEADSWRRVRQGAQFDFPRITPKLRPTLVYEIDLTNSDFLKNGPLRRNFENLFIALQDSDDPGQFRLLIGHNTHILSRDDNLSSGNLPTINRSLILEEHGSVNVFGAQLGVQLQKTLSPSATLQVSIGDNRGSLNAGDVKSDIGRSVAGKLLFVPINDEVEHRKLALGFGVDTTSGIKDRRFVLGTAIGQATLGSVAAIGTKLTWELDAAYTFNVAAHPVTLEGEFIQSRFSLSRSDVVGGYVMGQVSMFEGPNIGNLDLFARYDVVNVGQDDVAGRAQQWATRVGINYNLPRTKNLASLHLEFAHNDVQGPSAIVSQDASSSEVRLGLRISLQRYLRH